MKLELEETYEAGEVNAKASFRLLLDTGMACDHVRPPSRAITVEQTANSMVRLFWDERPRTVLVVKKPRDEASTRLLCEIAQFLREQKLVEQVLVEPPVFEELGQPAYLSSWDDRGASGSADKAAGIVRQDCGKAEKASVDVVVCLGGDGTMLWVSGLFPSAVPPVVSFSMGSLGFLTPYKSSNFKRVMRNVLEDGCQLTVRMRLFCQVVKGKAVSQLPSADARLKARSPTMAAPAMQAMAAAAVAGGGGSGAGAGTGNARTPTVMKFAPVPASIATPPFQTSVLNEVVIDRGPQMSLVMLDVFCDDVFVTRVQADGIIIATPTGSTAYSMSAGGSMVHPAVPCMLFTPICPHSLSFRPLLFPDSALLRCEIPASSRNNSWVSFDGKFRQEMRPGDSLLLRVGRYPMPSVSAALAAGLVRSTAARTDHIRSGCRCARRARTRTGWRASTAGCTSTSVCRRSQAKTNGQCVTLCYTLIRQTPLDSVLVDDGLELGIEALRRAVHLVTAKCTDGAAVQVDEEVLASRARLLVVAFEGGTSVVLHERLELGAFV